MDTLSDIFTNPMYLGMVFLALGCGGAILIAFIPLLQKDTLEKRIKAVSVEREAIRLRERERLAMSKKGAKPSLRMQTGKMTKQLVDTFDLNSWLGTEDAVTRLAMAGYRGKRSVDMFLIARLLLPIGFFFASLFYVFYILDLQWSFTLKMGVGILAAYIGIKAPEIYLTNITGKRQKEMGRAFPNMLDLLIICSEAGMSVELAVRKVGQEVGIESLVLAEEISLLSAELAYLENRLSAFENLAKRTGMDEMKQLAMIMTQAEKYGTSLAGSLRVLAQEARDSRMIAAEKKGASLPPALTVPMIFFFLPAIFSIILTPAIIQVFHYD